MSQETKLSPAENHCYKTPQTHKKYILYDHLVLTIQGRPQAIMQMSLWAQGGWSGTGQEKSTIMGNNPMMSWEHHPRVSTIRKQKNRHWSPLYPSHQKNCEIPNVCLHIGLPKIIERDFKTELFHRNQPIFSLYNSVHQFKSQPHSTCFGPSWVGAMKWAYSPRLFHCYLIQWPHILTRNYLWQLINSSEYKPLSKEVLTNLYFSSFPHRQFSHHSDKRNV